MRKQIISLILICFMILMMGCLKKADPKSQAIVIVKKSESEKRVIPGDTQKIKVQLFRVVSGIESLEKEKEESFEQKSTIELIFEEVRLGSYIIKAFAIGKEGIVLSEKTEQTEIKEGGNKIVVKLKSSVVPRAEIKINNGALKTNSYEVTINSEVYDADEMRIGKSEAELKLAVWEKYIKEKKWKLSEVTEKSCTVFAEFKNSKGTRVCTSQAIIIERLEKPIPSLPSGTYKNPFSVTFSATTTGAVILYSYVDKSTSESILDRKWTTASSVYIDKSSTIAVKTVKYPFIESEESIFDFIISPLIFGMIHVPAGATTASNGSITVGKDFYIGKYEVTQAEFQSVMGFNPSDFKGNNNPVEQVTWYDALAYCNAKSMADGLEVYYNISGITKSGDKITVATVTEKQGANGYRLPTTEEWEYAARGGKNGIGYTYSGSNTIGDVAWYHSNSVETTHPVGGKTPNELGIYDMSGNVWEWTSTVIGSELIKRGGSWYDGDSDTNFGCVVGNWHQCPPFEVGNVLGFRIVKSASNNVITATLASIKIKTPATKTSYIVGDVVDSAGLTLTATMSDDSIKIVTGWTVSLVDMSTTGTKTVTVSYTEGGVTKTTTFNISVNAVSVVPLMILVPSGKTTAANGGITVANDFYIGKYEVTQAEFQSLMGFNPSHYTAATTNNPVEQVTWYDAIAYCNAKSKAEGLRLYYNISVIDKNSNGNIMSARVSENTKANGYRLPTNEEWEYAARGGKNGTGYIYSGSNTVGDVAWFVDNSERKTHVVGTKAGNELGIYDMSGNVWEWTNNIYNVSYRIAFGGSWINDNGLCYVSYWTYYNPETQDDDVGFRLARSKEF